MKKTPRAAYVNPENGKCSLTLMVDCARNAVPSINTLEKLIDLSAYLGYDSLMLYLEDCFEVTNEPYFGYLRGRYSKAELKHIDAYGLARGIEIIPAIQTLAHLNQIKRWYEFEGVFDIDDILEVGSPRANLLLDHVFQTIRECFTSKRINVGMDEAHHMGRGSYFDKHGAVDRLKIIEEQMDFVHGLCEKYHFKPMMWSDMFFRMTYGNYYRLNEKQLPKEITNLVKNRFQMIYWDYYHADPKHYQNMIDVHRQLDNDIVFAAGIWKFSGFTPDNRTSVGTMKAGVKTAIENHIPDVIITAWGDNGGETSLFATLPSIIYAAALKYGVDDLHIIEKTLRELSGLGWDEFMAIDFANRGFAHDDVMSTNTTNKSMLFNDPLLGIMDSLASFIVPSKYQAYADELNKEVYKKSHYAYLFETQKALLDVLALKTHLGLELRQAYKAHDLVKLTTLTDTIAPLVKRLDVFHATFSKQWHLENKPHGFDVQDLRIGGLRARLLATKSKLTAYLKNETSSIPELEETLLDYRGLGAEFVMDPMSLEYRLKRISTVNVND